MLLTVSFESLCVAEVSCSQPDGRQLGKQADDASTWSGNQDACARIRLQQASAGYGNASASLLICFKMWAGGPLNKPCLDLLDFHAQFTNKVRSK